MERYIVTFRDLSIETKVRTNYSDKIKYEVIPVPKDITIRCGIAHRLEVKGFFEVLKMLRDNTLGLYDDYLEENIHIYTESLQDGKNTYTPFHLESVIKG